MESNAEYFAREGIINLEGFFDEEELTEALKEVLIRASKKNGWQVNYVPKLEDDEKINWKSTSLSLEPSTNKETLNRMMYTWHTAGKYDAMSYYFVRTHEEFVNLPLRELLMSRIDKICEITGIPANNFYSAFLSSYERGCFLTPHTDEFEDADFKPEFAFVLNLTTVWKPQWGGLLHIFDEDKKKIEKTIIPAFNSFTLFKLPRWHFVSEVANCAPSRRLAFSGWFNFIPKTP
jgi:Rps23 Pro-64 3,4-dihydroxylase Tpa1-like proline 4-hydroxylase